MNKENNGPFIIIRLFIIIFSVLASFFKRESFKEGIHTSFFATVGLGIFYYLDMKGLSLIFTIPLIILIYGLTILVILGLERMSIHENNWAQLFLIIGFVFYDVPASLGYLSYFANNDIALIFNLPFEFTVFITVFISIILFIIMYYYRNSTYFVKFKYYYTSSLILLIPLLGAGDKIQITEIDWIGLTLFAMVGFTPIFNKLREKKYLNSPDERKEFIYGVIMGFLVITVIIILYILIGHFNLVLNINPKVGKLLVGINGLIAYLAFSTSFADLTYHLFKKYINEKGKSENIQRNLRTRVMPLINSMSIRQILFNRITTSIRQIDSKTILIVVTILITILIDIILGTIILILRLPVHQYLVYSGLAGGLLQYIIPIIYILIEAKKKK
ncbi:hypothetical protein WIW89_05795 [Stygiolobus sp. CP850M]|uniref:hypothetical protein n=1 Tax=Stygiolobus sp. CP850M TaxID=3133134 RepID=UPI00307D6781